MDQRVWRVNPNDSAGPFRAGRMRTPRLNMYISLFLIELPFEL
jgi:hypothetical protein